MSTTVPVTYAQRFSLNLCVIDPNTGIILDLTMDSDTQPIVPNIGERVFVENFGLNPDFPSAVVGAKRIHYYFDDAQASVTQRVSIDAFITH